MKITQPDGTVIEGEVDELIAYQGIQVQTAQVGFFTDPEHEDPFFIQPPQAADDVPTKDYVDNNLPAHVAIEVATPPPLTLVPTPDISDLVGLVDTIGVVPARLPGEPRRGVKRHMPVTQYEMRAIDVMRLEPLKEWTTADVVEISGAEGVDATRLKAAVSKMCRDGRGVRQGQNKNHYYLDEFGKEAILHVFAKPTYQWGEMKGLWEARQNWVDNRPPAEDS